MSWFQKLKEGLSKSSQKIAENIHSVLVKKPLDDEVLAEIEDILIASDFGPKTAAVYIEALRKERFGKEVTDEEIRETLALEIQKSLEVVSHTFTLSDQKPFVILMVGVNGTGKTTTIGKLANKYTALGKKVMIAAGDTFRAAAVEQLDVWAKRANCELIKKEQGADPASLAFEALQKAHEKNVDILFIDTAGRLQNQSHLMAELQKIIRVMQKVDASAPHATFVTLDATTGQNAFAQIEIFQKFTSINGLIVTKLDGTAKGGVVVGLCDRYKIPIRAIGVGEQIEDLQDFDAKNFARSLMGISQNDV